MNTLSSKVFPIILSSQFPGKEIEINAQVLWKKKSDNEKDYNIPKKKNSLFSSDTAVQREIYLEWQRTETNNASSEEHNNIVA